MPTERRARMRTIDPARLLLPMLKVGAIRVKSSRDVVSRTAATLRAAADRPGSDASRILIPVHQP